MSRRLLFALSLLAPLSMGLLFSEGNDAFFEDPASCAVGDCPEHYAELADFDYFEWLMAGVDQGPVGGIWLGSYGGYLWSVHGEHGTMPSVATFYTGSYEGQEYRLVSTTRMPLYGPGGTVDTTNRARLGKWEAFNVVPACEDVDTPDGCCTGPHQGDGTCACEVAGTCTNDAVPDLSWLPLRTPSIDDMDFTTSIGLAFGAAPQIEDDTDAIYLECNTLQQHGGTGCDANGENCTSAGDACCTGTYFTHVSGYQPNLCAAHSSFDEDDLQVGGYGSISGCDTAGYTYLGPKVVTDASVQNPNYYTRPSPFSGGVTWRWTVGQFFYTQSVQEYGTCGGYSAENNCHNAVVMENYPNFNVVSGYADGKDCPQKGATATTSPTYDETFEHPPSTVAHYNLYRTPGDSGGPIFMYTGGGWFLVGVANSALTNGASVGIHEAWVDAQIGRGTSGM